MRWFIETKTGRLVQVRDVMRVTYDDDNDEVELIFEGGEKSRCTAEEWAAVKGQHQYVPAAPGIRLIDGAPYLKAPIVGSAVLAWRVGGGGWPLGLTLDCEAEAAANPQYIAYLYPDGRVETTEDGWFATLDEYTERFNERRESWKAKHAEQKQCG